VNCPVVRDRLSEHALGVVVGRDADAIDRHLEWCAACRKEARDLRLAAAVLPYSLAPAEPDPELEERVVETIRAAAARSRPEPAVARRSRLATVAVLAAALAVSALGWGAVMAGRASRAEEDAVAARERSRQAFSEFTDAVFGDAAFTDADVELGLLAATDVGGDAGGTAATIVVPRADDTVMLVANGLDASRGPYTVELRGGPANTLVVGVVPTISIASDGSAEFAATPDDDLRRFDRVVVVDGDDRVVLRGHLEAQAPVPSPSPSGS
jgi:hypothetical protein